MERKESGSEGEREGSRIGIGEGRGRLRRGGRGEVGSVVKGLEAFWRGNREWGVGCTREKEEEREKREQEEGILDIYVFLLHFFTCILQVSKVS